MRQLECIWHSQDMMGRPVSTATTNTTTCGTGNNNNNNNAMPMWASFPVAERSLSRDCAPCCGATDVENQKFFTATMLFRVGDFPALYDQLTASPQQQIAFEEQLAAEIGKLLQDDSRVQVESIGQYSTRRDLSVKVSPYALPPGVAFPVLFAW